MSSASRAVRRARREEFSSARAVGDVVGDMVVVGWWGGGVAAWRCLVVRAKAQ